MLAPATPAHAATTTCRGVRATIVGTPSNDVIHGTAGRDVIAGLDGNDTIFAGGGDDLVCGGDGSDHLFGGAGRDRLYGGKDLLHSIEDDTETEASVTRCVAARATTGSTRVRTGAPPTRTTSTST